MTSQRSRRSYSPIGLLLIGMVGLLGGCDEQSMVQQKRYDVYEPSPLWRNGSEAQPLPVGVVVEGDGERSADRTAPPPINLELLHRGRQRFEIYCTPCHGRSGDGDGMIVRRGFPSPPSFHLPRLRAAPAEHYFDVITNGFGAMYSYAARVEPRDRWAIIAYIRALQTSQNARLADVPAAKDRLQ